MSVRLDAPALDPIEALARLARGERPFLLDGAADADGLGRCSLAGCDPDERLLLDGDCANPAERLAEAHARWAREADEDGAGSDEEAPRPLAVGYLSHDLAEPLLLRPARRRLVAEDALGLPLVDVARYRAIWRRDAVSGRAEVIADDAAAGERLLRRLQATPPPSTSVPRATPRWAIAPVEYRRRLARVREHLLAGDVYQVNLAHRLLAPFPDDDAAALALYARLRAVAPAPLGAYLDTGSARLLSNTPELFLRVRPSTGGRFTVETRPIKGTRRRGTTPAEDARAVEELVRSEKDHAEHLMIVDLERNDLGRVPTTAIGSVTVEGYARVVTLPTVHHLVSTVRARMDGPLDLAALLRATFPGGSVTGAPKLRAVEILDGLEGVRRGPYCGAIGWLGARSLDLALAIRTAIVTRGELSLSVGGGIVVDSQPDEELDETHAKARAFLRALDAV